MIAISVVLHGQMRPTTGGKQTTVGEAEKVPDKKELLGKVPEKLWTKHPTNICLVKSARLAKTKIKEYAPYLLKDSIPCYHKQWKL